MRHVSPIKLQSKEHETNDAYATDVSQHTGHPRARIMISHSASSSPPCGRSGAPVVGSTESLDPIDDDLHTEWICHRWCQPLTLSHRSSQYARRNSRVCIAQGQNQYRLSNNRQHRQDPRKFSLPTGFSSTSLTLATSTFSPFSSEPSRSASLVKDAECLCSRGSSVGVREVIVGMYNTQQPHDDTNGKPSPILFLSQVQPLLQDRPAFTLTC